MYARKSLITFTCIVIASAGAGFAGAAAAQGTFPAEPGMQRYDPAQAAQQPAQPAAPSANNEAYRKLKTQCETDVACGKASGDVCVEAAALLVGADLPDEFREVKEEQRVKIALRLLERGVDSSNVARGRAYDWYNKIGILGLNSYADAYRAQELMDMMTKSGYAGGELRKLRGSTSILSFTSNEASKRAGCESAKKFLGTGKLDADSLKIAQEITGSAVCQSYETPKP